MSFSPLFPTSITPSDLHGLFSHASPFIIYDERRLIDNARRLCGLKSLLGDEIDFLPRYAVKANSHRWIINLLMAEGIDFDASSFFEVERLISIGVHPSKIMLTAQQLGPISSSNLIKDYGGFDGRDIFFNASSLLQLEEIGKLLNDRTCSSLSKHISVRINPGEGSGIVGKTKVAGVDSGFGIWHEYIPQIKELCQKYSLIVSKVHTHIGSGTDPSVWESVAERSLSLLHHFKEASWINLGGGFKVARLPEERSTDLEQVGESLRDALIRFREGGRMVHLELEPGAFLVADTGLLVAQVTDIVDTGKDGYRFIKLNCGMNDFMRPALYGAKHHLELLNPDSGEPKDTKKAAMQEYVIIGHCCEGSDRITAMEGDALATYALPEATVGDYVLIHGVGAYGSSMASNYNSFPFLAEFAKTKEGAIKSIRWQSKVDDLLRHELG